MYYPEISIYMNEWYIYKIIGVRYGCYTGAVSGGFGLCHMKIKTTYSDVVLIGNRNGNEKRTFGFVVRKASICA